MPGKNSKEERTFKRARLRNTRPSSPFGLHPHRDEGRVLHFRLETVQTINRLFCTLSDDRGCKVGIAAPYRPLETHVWTDETTLKNGVPTVEPRLSIATLSLNLAIAL